MKLATSTTWTELLLLLIAFVLSMIIGIERQLRQKSAGMRTHTLVGTGAALFTLVSGFGFNAVLGTEVNLDPSRGSAGSCRHRTVAAL
jgi:putative Mg2+ transporter-C (MgtC) family protein